MNDQVKAVLEICMPESCKECVLSYHYKNRITKINERVCVPLSLACEDYIIERASFCPLKPSSGADN